jgi:hypothetical protein
MVIAMALRIGPREADQQLSKAGKAIKAGPEALIEKLRATGFLTAAASSKTMRLETAADPGRSSGDNTSERA